MPRRDFDVIERLRRRRVIPFPAKVEPALLERNDGARDAWRAVEFGKRNRPDGFGFCFHCCPRSTSLARYHNQFSYSTLPSRKAVVTKAAWEFFHSSTSRGV